MSKVYNNISRFANKLKLYFSEVANYFLYKEHVYIQKSAHVFFNTYENSPPIPYTSYDLADLCHFHNQIPPQNTKPFIIDYEHPLALSGHSTDYVYMINSTKKIEEKLNSVKCKAISVPSEGALRETKKYLDITNINKKIHIIRPAYPTKPENLHNHNGPFTILTIGNKFWAKGIPIAIEVFRVLREKYDKKVNMNLICGDVPNNYPLVDGISLIKKTHLSDKQRSMLYSSCHMLLLPCLQDSYAVYQEAMAFGVPIVATNIYDKNEFIINNQTGYLVDVPISLYDGKFGHDWESWNHFQEIVKDKFHSGALSKMTNDLVERTELLFNDIDLVRDMAKAAQKLHKEEFSIKVRNSKVKNLYRQILSDLGKLS